MTTGYFITGASGFIGKRLVRKILARVIRVHADADDGDRARNHRGKGRRVGVSTGTRDGLRVVSHVIHCRYA